MFLAVRPHAQISLRATEILPISLWNSIFKFALPDARLGALVSYSLVCRDFFDLCIENCKGRLFYFVALSPAKLMHTEIKTIESERCRLLAQDDTRLFLVKEKEDHVGSTQALIVSRYKSGACQTIDLLELLKNRVPIPILEQEPQEGWQEALTIQNCVPVEQGVLFFSKAVITLWAFNTQGELEFVDLFSPYDTKGAWRFITMSAPQQRAELPCCKGKGYFALEIAAGKIVSHKIKPGNVSNFDKLVCHDGKWFGYSTSYGNNLNSCDSIISRIDIYKADLDLEFDSAGQTLNPKKSHTALFTISNPFLSAFQVSLFGQYTILACETGSFFVMCMKKELLIFEKINQPQNARELHIKHYCFIEDHILFMFDSTNNFEAVYLPNGKNVTELFLPFLAPYFKDFFIKSIKMGRNGGDAHIYLILQSKSTRAYHEVEIYNSLNWSDEIS